jgi:signal transduction histidine kinase
MPLTTYAALAERTARLLTQRYLIALAAVGVLSLLGQGLVQWALSTQAHDARLINLAGRQRMLSQQLAKSVIAVSHLPAAQATALQEETRSILAVWVRTHRGLQDGDASLDLPPAASPTVRARWQALEPAYQAFHNAVAAHMEGYGEDLSQLLEAQKRYLEGQEAVVWQLDHEASERVTFLRLLEFALFLILVAVLVAEGLLVFRPTVRRITEAIAARGKAEQRALEEHMAEAAGRMQRRIGQDLHDGLGQVLTGISFQAKALQRSLGDHPAAAQAAEIVTEVQGSIAQTRSLSRLLNPPAAEAEGLASAMRDLADNTARAYGLACECAWDEDLPLPATDDETPPGVHLFRIAQEAIANAARHGQARRITILGRVEAAEAMLEVEDDGAGFELAGVSGAGMGLRTLAYRAERLGARLTITRQDAGGMRLRVAWRVTAGGQARG